MAEGLAKNIFGASYAIESAGSHPTQINPLAIQAMKEINIDISNQYSKTAEELSPQFLSAIDNRGENRGE
jgi:arsenate reductase